MERKEILGRLAPCGLDCSRCAGFKSGRMSGMAGSLLADLNGYGKLAGVIKRFNPAFEDYDSFEAILRHFSNADCRGCRYDPRGCPVPCAVKECHKEHQVDFCGECPCFPCDRQGEIPIGERWLDMSRKIQEMGLEAYYGFQAERSRY